VPNFFIFKNILFFIFYYYRKSIFLGTITAPTKNNCTSPLVCPGEGSGGEGRRGEGSGGDGRGGKEGVEKEGGENERGKKVGREKEGGRWKGGGERERQRLKVLWRAWSKTTDPSTLNPQP
jgi:hypothetical protein